MRLFISLNPGANTLKKIAYVKDQLSDRIDILNTHFKHHIKWEQYSKFHMTLLFIGETDENRVNDIDKLLEKNVSNFLSSELHFQFKEYNAFPNMKYPRVLFLELTNQDGKVFSLSEKIETAMIEFGIKSDKKFYPHITLGRVKRDKKINLKNLDTSLNDFHSFTVSEFCLMKSVLTKFGSEYEILKRYAL